MIIQKITLLAVALFCFGLFSSTASAHLAGQPPFFKINGDYSLLYPLYTTSLSDFVLPQDIDTEPRLVNQTLQLEMDTSKLPIPPEIINQSVFYWDYGDGTKATGLKNNHTYTKMGSYILAINVKSPDSTDLILLQSVLINVVPNKDYQLPKAVILVNGQESKDPLTDFAKVNFYKEISFSAEKSQSQSKIVSYFWDFGDTQSSDQKTVNHRYDAEIHQYFPLLRIKTADGFIADAFTEVQGDELAPTGAVRPTTFTTKYPVAISLIGVTGFAALIALLIWKLRKS